MATGAYAERMDKLSKDQEIIAAAIAINAPFVGRLRSRTLVGSRWFALIGQFITVLVVHFGFDFELPLLACLLTIAANITLNIIITVGLPPQRLVRQWEAAAQLTFDVLQLALLLYLTGGIANPFCLLLIAPATIAASTLQPRWTLSIIGVTILSVGVLALYSYPLPWLPAGSFMLPALYQFAMAFAIVIGLLFTASYAWRVSLEESQLADALIATQEVLAREQKLAALGGLAAAAAHELGTPLATIQVTAKEMLRSLPPNSLDMEDAELILSQAQRCREILRNLTNQKEIPESVTDTLPFGQLLEEVAERHPELGNKAVLFDIQGPEGKGELMVIRKPAILYGLGNFLENAIHYAKQAVTVSAKWDERSVRVTITDDGPGFDEAILDRLGEPYISTSLQGSASATTREGMGLGFFIAKTLLERSGGQVSFWNGAGPGRGAVVQTVWPISAIAAKP
ncbi:ActS/PrrB/RegB family redox-sensitive histidine kinase [Aquidulcibacter paucihalophilus]|uniref:ActS/PrrB/RegB family redox-sensitive histidine kinase n=1 Tax=Aquidulcibacter paucihalophilus TaxID=1978549 RepID=UPI000A18F507|nr:ActS/PrrB/RegB family redox-sensitive histidine kinase [Aquidulcibacter paucihalophilus]